MLCYISLVGVVTLEINITYSAFTFVHSDFSKTNDLVGILTQLDSVIISQPAKHVEIEWPNWTFCMNNL